MSTVTIKNLGQSAKIVDTTAWYQGPQIGQMFFLMTNQTICIDVLEGHSLCSMQCHLNGVHISEVPPVLA